MSKQVNLPGVGMIALGVFIAVFVLLMLIGYSFLAAVFFALALAVAAAIFFLLLRDRRSDTGSHSTAAHYGGTHASDATKATRAAPVSADVTPKAERRDVAGPPTGAQAAPLMSNAAEPRADETPPEAALGASDQKAPESLDGPRGGTADDLKRIKGVGPKIEDTLNSMGFYHLDQIASWGPAEVAWMDENLENFPGRVSRDDWVGQARLLSGGGETEFSRRVDEGDVYD